jgi:histidine decarboxylase
MLGSPLPSGVVLAKKSHVERIARSIEYIGALDTTIAGSRSAMGPLFLWYRLRTLGREGITAMVRGSLECAAYAVDALRAHGIEAWRNENSVTVVFPRPPAAVMRKWILAPRRGIGHLLTMPHVTREIVDEFVADFAAALAKEKQPH